MMSIDGRISSIPLLAMVLLAVGGCSSAERAVGVFSELNALRADVATSFEEPVVSVNLNNGRYLTVGLVNSKRASMAAQDKRPLARQVAEFAFAHYKSRQNLERINVAFVKYRSFLVFRYTDSRDVYGFDADEFRGSQQ